MLLSCIGIGSNAIRMLEATWTDGGLCVLKRERRGTRLFAGLFNGRLQEVTDEVEACIKRVPLSDGELDYVAAAGVLYTSSGTDRTDILKG